MKFTMARGEMLESLSVVSRGLSSRSTLPILSGILLSAGDDGSVVLNSTDLEVSIKSTATALVEKPGTAVVPGKLVFDIVRSLPEAAVTISTEGEMASITCGQSAFSVKTLKAEDFPRFPEISAKTKIILPAKVMSEMISHVGRAVSRDETRPIFTGVLVVSDGPTLRMVATDSYRLAVKETLLDSPESEDMEVVVPGKALEEVAKLASTQENVALGVSDNQIVFEVGDTVFITRRIEGTFPNYRQLIPKEFETNVTVSREELAAAVKRVSLLAQHNTPLRLTVSSEDKTLSLSATTQDIGDASEDLMADVEGPDVEIAFNHQFLNDGMAVATGDTVKIEIVSPLKPGVITSHGDEGFMYLLMPVRLG